MRHDYEEAITANRRDVALQALTEAMHDLVREGVVWLKDTAVENTKKERLPWKKKQYAGMLVASELRDNRFFKDEAYYTEKGYTKVETDKQPYWVDDSGKEWYLDNEIERTQYFLTIEVLDGDKQGDWCWVWAPHRFGYKKDNTPFGVRAKIALAIDEDWNLGAGGGIEDDNSDLLRKPFYFTVEPKPDKQYCKVTDFLPMEKADRIKYELGATEDAGYADAPIPF